MVVSHNIGTALQVLSDFNVRTTQPTLSVRDAIDFAVKVLPDVPHDDSDIFNFCIKQIQNALGQDSGDNAGMFFLMTPSLMIGKGRILMLESLL